MSPTLLKIGSAKALITNAGQDSEDQATIIPLDRPVYVECCSFSQDRLCKLTRLLNCGIRDRWVSDAGTSEGKYHTTSTPVHFRVPRVCVSPALDPKVLPEKQREPNYDHIDYILVVQDAVGSLKMVTEPSLSAAARTMLHEALNGFSIVFSGALFHCNIDWMFRSDSRPSKIQFKTVMSINALNGLSVLNGKEGTIGVIC